MTEQKSQYEYNADIARLKRQCAILEQQVIAMVASAPDVLSASVELRQDVDDGNFADAERKAEYLKSWLMRGHDVANTLTIVSGFIELGKADDKEQDD